MVKRDLQIHQRRIKPLVISDLKEKMVFISGPRQCGKTTLSEVLLKNKSGTYYNWDNEIHRKILRNHKMDEGSKLWVFDELHKLRTWKSWLKGVYDVHKANHQFLVTGSARMDTYKKGSDSLSGRYYFHRLHPFTFSEYTGLKTLDDYSELVELPNKIPKGADEALRTMLELGSFPEPLFSGSARKAARWRMSYASRLIREEIRSVEDFKNLDKIELLFERLPDCVGSVLSMNSLRQDLEVAFPTIKSWIQVLEKFYACFLVAPFAPPRIKAVKKEQKLFMWDWGHVENKGARFENLIGLHLLRLVHWLRDCEGVKAELRYFRSTEKKEVDFIVLKKNKPWLAVEVKTADRDLDPNLRYFLERVKVPYAFQVSLKGEKHVRVPDINGCKVQILPATKFLSQLP